jgi:uncharacterized pyridoxamine 5'-phosphate oxidase family protein
MPGQQMHETPSDIERLQKLLDDSYADAGEYLLSIITPDKRISAEDVCRELQGMTLLNLATVTAKGEPIVSPVDGIFYRGLFWFGSGQKSVRFRHIRARPAVSATHTRGEELVVTVHGRAVELDKRQDYEGFKECLREVYGRQWDSWGYWEKEPFAYIEPRVMFAASFEQAS